MFQIRQDEQQRQGWTSEPNCGAGTTSIIWQCLTTISLCAYVSVHLNIPPLSLSKTMTLVRKLFTVGAGVLMPELWAWLAALDLVAARRLVKRTAALDCGISLRQAFFINSGGLAIKGLHSAVPLLKPLDLSRRPVTAHSASLYLHEHIWRRTSDRLSDQEVKFLAQHVPSDEEIDDKSKQDALAKLIALLQVLWTLIQIIARGQQGLAIPLIQVATLGYIAIAVCSYACWWEKPYDIETPHVLEAKTVFDDEGKLRIDPSLWLCASRETLRAGNLWVRFTPTKLLRQVPQAARFGAAWNNDTFSSADSIDALYLGLLTMVFAGIDLIAWNYSFPTAVEAWMWRILMLVSIGFGIGIVAVSTRMGKAIWQSEKGFFQANRFVGFFAQVYLVSRLFLIVECFISFRDAPSSVYAQVDWGAYVPHFGA